MTKITNYNAGEKGSLRRKIKKTYKTKDKSHREKTAYGVRFRRLKR